jgi:hypothetical protein
MTERDQAFLWETEAIRSATHRVAEAEIDAVASPGASEGWLTLRAASRATGIPVETLRKWARRGSIPSYLAAGEHGTQIRLVDIDGVVKRAGELGRDLAPETVQKDHPGPSPATQPPPPRHEEAPPGSMIIPVDAWNKMLTQLGNLHEAGQQLAEARERAARAETEASFLRERLAELRHQVEVTPRDESPQLAPPPEPTPTPGASDERVWDYVMRRMRGWRRG